MDILYLPFAQWNDSLQLAIQRMKNSDSHWLVVHHRDDEYMLHINRTVLEAREKGVEQCGELRDFPGETVAVLSDDLARNRADALWELVEGALDRKQAFYGLPFEPLGDNPLIALATRHEIIGYRLRSATRVCACIQGHEYTEPPSVDGTSCPHDGTDILCL